MRSARNILLGGIALVASAAPAPAEILIGVPAPYTGPLSWYSVGLELATEMAIAELNAAGGLLGQDLKIIKVDDYCDGAQAVAAANKLIAENVHLVLGHACSAAAIPASAAYAEAGVLMITTGATNPLLTERGLKNVFRTVGRDDHQGALAGNYLADYWSDKNIAILHDGGVYGQGLAEETQRTLSARSVSEVMFEAIQPGLGDYSDIVEKVQAVAVDVLYYGGLHTEAGLLLRQLRDQGEDLQFVSGDAIGTEDFGLIAGRAAEGMLFTDSPTPQHLGEAADLVTAFRAQGYEPTAGALASYGAMQIWSQAVEKVGTTEMKAVAEALRFNAFDTVLGRIGFDAKGDVTGYEPFAWYVWKGGNYEPVDPAAFTE